MKLKIYQIDAFTNTVFKGNSAAVIVIDEWLSEDKMQAIAIENNLSETAFTKKCDNSTYEIRWFSPITEINFCGHATLATAFVLFQEDSSINEVIFLAKAVGSLKVKQLDDGYIEMIFPNRKPSRVESIPEELKRGLSIEPKDVYVNQQTYFVIYPNEEDVYNVQVKLTGLAPLWAEILDKNELLAYQASKRGGILKCKVNNDHVIIQGQAIQYLEGYINI